MTSLWKAISSIAVACAACGALTIGISASAATPGTRATTSLSYSFNETYQEYASFFTGSTTRTASSEEFSTKVTTFSGPKYSATGAVYAPNSSAGAYSYSATIDGKGTFSADYIFYSASSTETRPVVLGISFDSRETPGSTFKISGTFYPNGN